MRTNYQHKSLVLWLLMVIAASTMVLAQPQAVPLEPVVDVGVVNRGVKIQHRFVIRNEGDESLAIREVQPACGCTVAEYDRAIAAGEEGSIEAVVDTSDFRGPIAKSITVFTTDPDNARFTLTVKANIRMQVESKPGYARMIVVQGEPTEPMRQWLWSSDGPPLEVTGVRSPIPSLSASYRLATAEERRSEGAQRQWLVDLVLAEDAPVGPVAGNVLVQTNHPRQRELKIPVSGFVRSVVSVKPRTADFGSVELTEPLKTVVEIKNLGSTDVAVLSATSDLAGASTRIEEIAAGRHYIVEVTLDSGMTAGPFAGTVQIETSSELAGTVEVAVKGTVL